MPSQNKYFTQAPNSNQLLPLDEYRQTQHPNAEQKAQTGGDVFANNLGLCVAVVGEKNSLMGKKLFFKMWDTTLVMVIVVLISVGLFHPAFVARDFGN